MVDFLLRKTKGIYISPEVRTYGVLEDMKETWPEKYEVIREKLSNPKAFQVFELIEAADQGNISLAKLILQYGINQGDLEEYLCEAVKIKKSMAVATLLERGVDPNARQYRLVNKVGDPDRVEKSYPIQLALEPQGYGPEASKQRLGIVYLLIKAGAYVNDELLVECGEAAAKLKYPEFTLFLAQRGYDPALFGSPMLSQLIPDGTIYRSLQAAAQGNRFDVVKWLVNAGADVKAPPAIHDGLTVLEAAANTLSVEEIEPMFKYLLALGAPVNRPDGTSSSVLHSLLLSSLYECLSLALDAGARVDALEEDFGLTPLQAAAYHGDIEAVSMLLSHGSDINACAADGPQGRTALQAAAEASEFETVKLLLQNGADVNAPSSAVQGRTALQAAAEASKFEVVELLLRNDADVNAPAATEYGRTALQAATSSERCDPRIVALLISSGADINAAPSAKRGVTALQGAAIKGDLQIARILLHHGADVNANGSPEEGRTAVEGAAEWGRLEMVRLLLSVGAMPDPVDGFSRAIKLADENEHYAIGDLLEKFVESGQFLFTGSNDWLDENIWTSLPEQGMVMDDEEVDWAV
ncbi:hypothetical protein QQX98_006225 [Neonectria punicea]|uniref:Ankyrin n=1 Tax=Neonectria punicea TaxID=979145 RepID=A0ABR1H290_9HYPO